MQKLIALSVFLGLGLFVLGCEPAPPAKTPTPPTTVTQEVEKAAEKTADAVKDGAEKVGAAAEKAADAVKDEVKKAADAVAPEKKPEEKKAE